jgi:4-aminobutyrate aminotransferase/(S)-3-amino-2-methylpropionate transaminase
MKCEPPGPRSKELLRLRNLYVTRGVKHVANIFIEESEGALIKDVDGNIYIDFVGGFGALNVGHRNPEVLRAISDQAKKYLHVGFQVTPYEPYIKVAKKLIDIGLGDFEKKVLLVNSGTEANENAIRIAKAYTKRHGIIYFQNSFHGRSLLMAGITGRREVRNRMEPFPPEIFQTPYAYCYRCPLKLNYSGCDTFCIDYLRSRLEMEIDPEDVAAIIVEPIQGDGGFIVPPKEFHIKLRKLANEHGIVLIDDEIQQGFGRTGTFWAIEQFGVVPDLITAGKSLGGGLPLSAVLGRAEIMDAPLPGSIGGTFYGNPISCAAALVAINKAQELQKSAKRIGDITRKRFLEMQEKFDIIGDVRGLGADWALELVRNRRTKEPAVRETHEIVNECLKNGLLIWNTGIFDNVLVTLMPLVITSDQLTKGLDILEKAINKVNKK